MKEEVNALIDAENFDELVANIKAGKYDQNQQILLYILEFTCELVREGVDRVPFAIISHDGFDPEVDPESVYRAAYNAACVCKEEVLSSMFNNPKIKQMETFGNILETVEHQIKFRMSSPDTSSHVRNTLSRISALIEVAITELQSQPSFNLAAATSERNNSAAASEASPHREEVTKAKPKPY